MLVASVLDAEVVDQEGEAYRAGVVLPEARCDSALVVAVLVEACLEQFLRDDPGVGESIHAAHALHIDVTFGVDFVLEFVVLDDVVGEVRQFHSEELRLDKRGVQVEVIDVDSHELCARRQDDAVE